MKLYTCPIINLNAEVLLRNKKIRNFYMFCFYSFVFSDARNMARDVHDVLMNILKELGEMDEAKAADYIKKLQNKGRYSCDVWS